MKLAPNAFRPWLNGSEQKDILVGDPEGKPYVVRASKNNWLPINLIIFAKSKEDAIDRVHYALLESMEIKHESCADRREALLDLFETGSVQAEEYDLRYVCSISWDSRGIL